MMILRPVSRRFPFSTISTPVFPTFLARHPAAHNLPLGTRRRRTISSSSPPLPTAARSSSSSPLIPAPSESSGPLLERLPNRALPSVTKSYTWLTTLPIFVVLLTISALGIFNYQKSSSSTVNSILYALRTSNAARAILGDEIYFRSKVPWISGELNQLHGNIDIRFWVKGQKGAGKVRFVSVRRRRDGFFETLEWSLETPDGKIVHLLDQEGGFDPFQNGGQNLKSATT